jgi:hypothetical protein
VVEEGLRQLTSTPGAELEPYWAGNEQAAAIHVLNIRKTGTGKGTVKSAPSGIRCGTDCSEAFVAGTHIHLIARAAKGSVLVGWSLPCPTSGNSCDIAINAENAAKLVEVEFMRLPDPATTRLDRLR